ncbi:type IV pili methyl-accepting chemotaxis transducer N-terminal domain-containing protein [Cupriavidus pauculus]|uniref:type IV pili methyl-accepting chemotaxis transducer N-terminal domain-containing protein n=1 Tax=Cupriavidus pauculus TaxID=82633 RepID=UPI001EE396C9|nr:type IV pili methyl-accepting chemotaxis transducer N-terminal domain-containing protein [Cupriavidus pauculus]GJG95719.1 HAMP domain-containing protein [Cupriavidus pauculus]
MPDPTYRPTAEAFTAATRPPHSLPDTDHVPDTVRLTPPRYRLSTRIILLSLASLTAVLAMITGTLFLSWKLEGAGAAINDAGSLRMRANRVAIELSLSASGNPSTLAEQITTLDNTLAQLRKGNPARPLVLPDDPTIHAQLDAVLADWSQHLKPMALAGNAGEYVRALPGFVDQADRLVRLIERNSARKTDMLRLSQVGLAAMACVGTVAVIYLLYLWIILPVLRLQDGLRRMAAREFSLRLPVETRDEFGTLNAGFNRMAAELQELYHDLAARVTRKTAELANQNRDLEALYDMAAFLNQAADAESLARGFLERVMQQFGADGGSVRMFDVRQGRLNRLASVGLSMDLADDDHCADIGACHCGQATQAGIVTVADLRRAILPMAAPVMPSSPSSPSPCRREGFLSMAAFRLDTLRGPVGTLTLHFRAAHDLPPSHRQLLETMAQHLATALEHVRLSASARQLAVVEERNLVAQGLHDSIAQGLNFLNLQVQLLEDAAERRADDEVQEIIPLLRHGVEESYQDVRELLNNFRSRLTTGDLRPAVEETVARFRRQCRTEATLSIDDKGLPLQPEHQLQVLFILQEALSNVRKHAMAEHVTISIRHDRVFRLVVQDDGDGFDASRLDEHDTGHIGLHIMRERAARLGAHLAIEPRAGLGVRIELTLPRGERTAASPTATAEEPAS